MKLLFTNKKIGMNYSKIDSIEAGICLHGNEVKSLAISNANIDDSFVLIKNNEAWLMNCYITEYKSNNSFYDYDPLRNRKLLLHKNEIIKYDYQCKKFKYNLIPSRVYFKNKKIKIEIWICKSKKQYDHREDLKKRSLDREIKNYY